MPGTVFCMTKRTSRKKKQGGVSAPPVPHQHKQRTGPYLERMFVSNRNEFVSFIPRIYKLVAMVPAAWWNSTIEQRGGFGQAFECCHCDVIGEVCAVEFFVEFHGKDWG